MKALNAPRLLAILLVIAFAASAAGETASQSTPACPECGSNEYVVPIVYGYPSEELFEAADRGEVCLGG
jgi:hypothetical protein